MVRQLLLSSPRGDGRCGACLLSVLCSGSWLPPLRSVVLLSPWNMTKLPIRVRFFTRRYVTSKHAHVARCQHGQNARADSNSLFLLFLLFMVLVLLFFSLFSFSSLFRRQVVSHSKLWRRQASQNLPSEFGICGKLAGERWWRRRQWG